MKSNEKMCQNCMGLTKKTYYWAGKQLCENCYLEEIEKELDAISEAKAVLAERVDRLQKESGKAIYFGIDDSEEVYVSKGLDIISKALNTTKYHEDYDFGGSRETVTYGSTDFYTAELGV